MTVFNQDMTTSRCNVFQIRSIKDSQNVREFISKESNYLMITKNEMELLRNNENSLVELEIFINE